MWILRIIFNFLDFESVNNAFLVCWKWNDIISTSAKFLNNTWLRLHLDKDDIDLNSVARCYRNIIFEVESGESKSKVTKSEFFNFLRSQRSILKRISFHNIHEKIFDQNDDEIEPIEMNILIQLWLNGSDWICDFIKCEKVYYLYIINITESCEKIIKFMNQQKNVKKLHLSETSLDDVHEMYLKFKWKELTITANQIDVKRNLTNLEKILDASEHNATIELSGKFNENFLKFLFHEIQENRKITHFSFQMEVFESCSMSLFDKIARMSGIRVLIFPKGNTATIDHHRHVSNLITKVSKIHELRIDESWSEFFKTGFDFHQFQYFNSLKILKIDTIRISGLTNFDDEALNSITSTFGDSLKYFEIENFTLNDTKYLSKISHLFPKEVKIYYKGNLKCMYDITENIFENIYKILPALVHIEMIDLNKGMITNECKMKIRLIIR